MKHGTNALPATAPADAGNAPYGLHFNPGTRVLSWPDDQPADGDNLSATLTYETYLAARVFGTPPAFNYNYPEYVADTATVTVTRKARPLPTQVLLRTIKQSKSINDEGSPSGQTGEKDVGQNETLEPGDHVDIRVTYDAPVAFATDTTERPTFNLTVGSVTRQVTLNSITTDRPSNPARANNSVAGRYTFVAADHGAIGVPNLYLKDEHLLVGASAAPAAERGNAVRPSLTSNTEKTGRHGATVQSGGPTFSVGSNHEVTFYNTVDDSAVLPAATSPTGKTLTYALRQNYPNSPNLGGTAEPITGLKFNAATRTLSRDKGEVPAIVNPTVYILTATESGDDGKSVRLDIGIRLLNQPTAESLVPFFEKAGSTEDNIQGDMATGDTLYLILTFNKNVAIKADLPTPNIRIQIGDSVREAPLSYWTRASGERINPNKLRGVYTVVAADHDHDGITLANDWLVNPESIVGTDPKNTDGGTGHATYENPVRYADVTTLTLSSGQITVHKAFGWPEAVAKPALTIVTNRTYSANGDQLGNTLPAANAAGHTRDAIEYRSTLLPAGLADILHVKADGAPQLVGFHTDPDRNEHDVTTEHIVTATVKVSAPVISDTLDFSIRIISDVLLDGNDNIYSTGDKIRVIVNHKEVSASPTPKRNPR